MQRDDDAWRARLTPQQYAVARCGSTEPPFANEYWDCHDPGGYRCVCCDAELFRAEHKFDSGTGWPSFQQPAAAEAVATRDDHAPGLRRTEVRCAVCDAHLGHLFDDGPAPSGQRYCINSAALRLARE